MAGALNRHIERTDDFGRMVYAMVARVNFTTDDDHPDHFARWLTRVPSTHDVI